MNDWQQSQEGYATPSLAQYTEDDWTTPISYLALNVSDNRVLDVPARRPDATTTPCISSYRSLVTL